jgi:2-polyprenyl-3-methyl-5-hydroxy-6-metoxy-1,4-benzoquinol methylase
MMLDSFKLKDRDTYQKWWIDTQATNYVTADQLRVAWTLDVIRRLEPGNILEIGSQTGGMTRLLLPICPDITAIDIVPNQLEMVAQLGVKTDLCFAEDLHNLDIGEFDVVLLTEILNHVPDAALVVSNAWGKVRPEGSLLITVPFGDRWAGNEVARYFNDAQDLMSIVRMGTGYTRLTVEHLDYQGETWFFACCVRKRKERAFSKHRMPR